MKNRIVIIDGNSLINRAYYAMQKPMITKEGIYTQGIFGFLNMLNRILDDYDPDYMAVAWDMRAPTFRHEAYKDYKAGRRKMPAELAMELEPMKKILDAMHIPNLELEGYEADDIIGTLARRGEEEGLDPLIITGDKDALQLCTHKTQVLITRRGISEFDLFDYDKMLERYEVTPEQFIDLKGLMGDPSDNIPGIPGVGEKTGIKLLKQFGSVAELLAHTDEISNARLRAKVEENAQLAAMSRKLAEINTHVPLDIEIESLHRKEPDYEKLVELYTKLEFNRFLRQLNVGGVGNVLTETVSDDTEYEKHRIDSPEDLKLLEALPEGSEILIRVFGNNDHVETPVIQGISLICGNQSFFVTTEGQTESRLIEILNRGNFRYAGHDLIADYYMLMSLGLRDPVTAFDSAVAEYVLDPGRSNYDLKTLSFEYLHTEIQSEKEFREANDQMDLLGQDLEAMEEYGAQWCRNVKLLRRLQEGKISANGQEKLCFEIEFPLIAVLAGMEAEGVSVDRGTLEEIGDSLSGEVDGIEEQIHELCGEKFNVNSPAQLGPILFEKLGLPAGKKTKRGYSTSAEVLEKIRDKHPVVPLILQYRTLTKLNSTYVEGIRPLIGSDGRIHAHFQQTVAATGRLSCTEPNLQNIPVRYEMGRQLRRAFVAGEKELLIGADYSQIELRIMAHLSGDENLISAFNNGDDIHRMTAARVFELDYDKVTPLDRSRAKAVNFGVIYGMSSFGLSENLHISRKEAERYIQEYFQKHRAVKEYLDSQVAYCREHGYTLTMFGRRRYINEIASSNYMTRQLGERLAMNSPIQGTAADIIKIAMNRVCRELTERGMKSRLVLQIHDELIICAAEDEVEDVKELLLRNMESAAELSVELSCDMNTGRSWYDLKN